MPFVGVNHLEGHLFASLIEEPELGWPLVVLLVSGGHTLLVEMAGPGHYRLLGQTIDDAAGEAYDKVARYLGLGYPGGPAIDRIAAEGDPTAFAFPRAMLDDGYDFSFSGLKTAVVRTVERHPEAADRRRGRLVPGGGGGRAGGQGPAGRSAAIGARGLCLGRRGGGQLAAAPARSPRPCGRLGVPPTCPAWPCAPTTRPWWRPPGPGGWATTARARCRSAADPNLFLPLSPDPGEPARVAGAAPARRPARRPTTSAPRSWRELLAGEPAYRARQVWDGLHRRALRPGRDDRPARRRCGTGWRPPCPRP